MVVGAYQLQTKFCADACRMRGIAKIRREKTRLKMINEEEKGPGGPCRKLRWRKGSETECRSRQRFAGGEEWLLHITR